MIIFKIKPEPIQEEETTVWICQKENCFTWIREGLSFDVIPLCPICNSDMALTTKVAPVLKRILKIKIN